VITWIKTIFQRVRNGNVPIFIYGGGVMVKFYDPKDESDLARVEAVLKEWGIEYFLISEPEAGIGSLQVHVAEEDVPLAEKLLLKEDLKKEQIR